MKLHRNLKFYLWFCCENKIRKSCYRINWTHFPLFCGPTFIWVPMFCEAFGIQRLLLDHWSLKFYVWTLLLKTGPEGFCSWLNHFGIAFIPPQKKKKETKKQIGVCYNWKMKGTVMPLWTGHLYVTSLCPQNHLFGASSWIILFLPVLGLSSSCMCISHWLYTCAYVFIYTLIEFGCITILLGCY